MLLCYEGVCCSPHGTKRPDTGDWARGYLHPLETDLTCWYPLWLTLVNQLEFVDHPHICVCMTVSHQLSCVPIPIVGAVMHDSGVDLPPLSLLPLPGVGTASSKTKQMLSSGFILGCMVESPGSFTLTSRPCPRPVKTLGQGAFGKSGTGHRCWCGFFGRVLVFLSSPGHVNVQ